MLSRAAGVQPGIIASSSSDAPVDGRTGPAFSDLITPMDRADIVLEATRNSGDKSRFLTERSCADPEAFLAALTGADIADLRAGSLAFMGYQPVPKGAIVFGDTGAAAPEATALGGIHQTMMKASPIYHAAISGVLNQASMRVVFDEGTKSASCQPDDDGACLIRINPALTADPGYMHQSFVFEVMNAAQSARFKALSDKAAVGGYETPKPRGLAAAGLRSPVRPPALSRRLDRIIARAPNDHAATRYAVDVERVEQGSRKMRIEAMRDFEAGSRRLRPAEPTPPPPNPAGEGAEPPDDGVERLSIAKEVLLGHTPYYAHQYDLVRSPGHSAPDSTKALLLHNRRLDLPHDDGGESIQQALATLNSVYLDPHATVPELRAAFRTHLRAAILLDMPSCRQVLAEASGKATDDGRALPAEARAANQALDVALGTGDVGQQWRMLKVVNEVLPELNLFRPEDRSALGG